MQYPVFDNHVHLQMNGENVFSAKRFEKAGGKILNICNIPKMQEPKDINYFIEQYNSIIKIANMVKNETNLKVLISIGPYPVDLIKAMELLGNENAKYLFMKAIDIAIKYIEDGKANAIGEIGRPHFPVSKEIWILQ
jgi:Predicted metal-dependent hydrolase (urease superfamily)